jgi:hypothetical protein
VIRKLSKFTCSDCGTRVTRRSGNQQRCRKCATVRNAATHKAAAIARGYRNGLGHGGAHNGGWKGGISLKWARHRKRRHCERCGATRQLEQHHRDQDTKNNLSHNLITLCKACHDSAHQKISRKCIRCSNGFFPSGKGQLRCAKCIPVYRNEWKRAYYREWRKKQKGTVYRDPQ